MDAARYFELMHTAMSAQKPRMTLLLTVKVQDLGGADAYLELRQNPADGSARVLYSTMGRRNLNFQLFRKGWQLCHNASGEMTSRFPSRAEELLDAGDFSAYIREDALDAKRTAQILRELHRRAGSSYGLPLSAGVRTGAIITTESFVGQGGEWVYSSDHAGEDLPLAAILFGRFSGRKRTPHPPKLLGGRSTGCTVAGCALAESFPPHGSGSGRRTRIPRSAANHPPGFLRSAPPLSRPERTLAEHPRGACDGVTAHSFFTFPPLAFAGGFSFLHKFSTLFSLFVGSADEEC